MNRAIKKAISFCIAMVICIGLTTPSVSAYAINEGEYILHTIAKNEYTDAVQFGKGHLMLKDGKFNKITSKTKFFYVDDKGNTKEIKNTIGFTEVYLNTSGTSYYVEDEVLAVGKNGKVGIIDINGNMYGGSENFYSCVIHAGKDLFYTTNATTNYQDKANTKEWTLRTKSGKKIKEFKNLQLENRMSANGYEYIFFEEGGKTNLIAVNSAGVIKTIGTGYDSYYVDPATGYVVTKKKSDNYQEVKLGVFNKDGSKIFELNGCTDVDLSRFDQFGFAKVSMAKETSQGVIYSENLINRSGKMLLPQWKYSGIKSYDGDRILAFDEAGVSYLLDHSQNVKFNSKDFQKKYGEQYEAISFSSYYVNSTLTISLTNNKNQNEEGRTFLLDKNANVKYQNIKGYVSDFDGSYAKMYEVNNENYGIVNNKGEFMIRGYGNITLERNSSVDIIARVKNEYWHPDILVRKDGKIINNYEYVDEYFTNGHAVVRDKVGKTGVIDKAGNEIVKCGEYNQIILYEDTESFIGYKGSTPYIFNKEGKPLNKANEYKSIGDYETKFYKFKSVFNDESYRNAINSKDIAITKDGNDKFGLVQVRDYKWEMCDTNNDGKIDILDISTVGLLYGKSSGQTGWRDDLDINKDKVIDLFDLVLISKKI